jgi:hypothetical protein
MNVASLRLEQVTRFFMRGSALAGTMQGGALGLETHIEVESNEPPERIRQLIRMGEQTCFTLQSLIQPVPTETHVRLNGQEFALVGE